MHVPFAEVVSGINLAQNTATSNSLTRMNFRERERASRGEEVTEKKKSDYDFVFRLHFMREERVISIFSLKQKQTYDRQRDIKSYHSLLFSFFSE